MVTTMFHRTQSDVSRADGESPVEQGSPKLFTATPKSPQDPNEQEFIINVHNASIYELLIKNTTNKEFKMHMKCFYLIKMHITAM